MLVTVVVLGIMAFLVPQIFNAYDERQKRLDDVNNTLQENLSGVRVVKAFVREDMEMEKFAKRADEMRKPAFRAAFRVAFFSPMLSGISQLAIALAILVGGTQVLNNTGLSIGELISFTQYLNMVDHAPGHDGRGRALLAAR